MRGKEFVLKITKESIVRGIEIGKFIRVIESAHKNAKKSKLRFGT